MGFHTRYLIPDTRYQIPKPEARTRYLIPDT
jgi:hypothetical protein